MIEGARARLFRPGRTKRWPLFTQVGDVYKKRKPLIHLEENSTKVTNKFSREVQARNLELSVQACLWLCRKNQAATLDSEEREKEQKSEERLQRASKEVGRSKTAALPFIKPKARDRFERKKTSDLKLRKSYITKESSNTTPKESTGSSESSSEDKKLSMKKTPAKVKKTGRSKQGKKEEIDRKEKKRAITKKIKTHIKLRNKKYK